MLRSTEDLRISGTSVSPGNFALRRHPGRCELARHARGPTAGYFARREPVRLDLAPVPLADGPALPMVYDISMGVRRDDVALWRELDFALEKHAAEIRAVLVAYGVPLIEIP
ncbi:MAG: hypothetical protein ABI454_00410 [Sphingomicrobium sp.]